MCEWMTELIAYNELYVLIIMAGLMLIGFITVFEWLVVKPVVWYYKDFLFGGMDATDRIEYITITFKTIKW